jgi:hypothetical protein
MKRDSKKRHCFGISGFTPTPICTVAGQIKVEEKQICRQISNSSAICKLVRGFTLAEAVATLAIAAMIMVAAIGIYTAVKRSEAAINKRLEGGFVAIEILQRIAEDIDRLALPSSDVTMAIKNKTEAGGYKSAQMIIESKIYDKNNKPQVFEKITWQSRLDPDMNSLVVYRAHGGYTLEDKMLDEPKEKYERERFIPICSGVTIFSIETVNDNNTIGLVWEGPSLPPGVRVSISSAAPQQDLIGNLVVPAEEIKTRTVVINRFKQLTYQFVYKEFVDANHAADVNDQNVPAETNEPNMYMEPNEISGSMRERTRR